MQHQYIERETGKIRTEALFGDRWIRLLYSKAREKTPVLYRTLTSSRMSGLLGYIHFDCHLGGRRRGGPVSALRSGIDLGECLEPPESLDSPRKIFERKIRYEECRPMPVCPFGVVSPSDSRVLLGSFRRTSSLFVKDKFFHYEELLGLDKGAWLEAFSGGDFAVFRLTPEKYHYNHVPVTGVVRDIYAIEGRHHSCNPYAVVEEATPYSKNKRVVTILDTDVPGGSRVGLVAMVEVVALMIGEIVQCYSEEGYDNPRSITEGMLLHRGSPKSLFRPGSSTVILIMQKGRVTFAEDLLKNLYAYGVASRFSFGFGRALVETEVKVRSLIAETAAGCHEILAQGE